MCVFVGVSPHKPAVSLSLEKWDCIIIFIGNEMIHICPVGVAMILVLNITSHSAESS